jgi:hypothetical protein
MAIPPGSEDVFHVGMTRRYDDYSVLVKQISERGPIEIEVEFARSLDDPRLCIFVQDDAHLYQLKPPPVGADHVIEAVPPLQLLSRAGAYTPSATLSAQRVSQTQER